MPPRQRIPEQHSLSATQLCWLPRQPVAQTLLGAGHPRLAQHSLDAVHWEPAVRHGAVTQYPAGHCRPAQHSLESWQVWLRSAQPTRGAQALSTQLPEQQFPAVVQYSLGPRQPSSHWLLPLLQRSPAQQSRLVMHSPLGSGLQPQTWAVWPAGAAHPNEQHSSCASHPSPTCLHRLRGRVQEQPVRTTAHRTRAIHRSDIVPSPSTTGARYSRYEAPNKNDHCEALLVTVTLLAVTEVVSESRPRGSTRRLS